MKLVVLIFILPAAVTAGLFRMLMAEGCDFDRDTTSYVCVKIRDQFPKMYYGDYKLRCMYCEIDVLKNDTFPSKNTLRVFNVSESKIHTITSNAFENLKDLEHIHLENNEISNITQDAFRGLRRVYELHLEHNKLTSLTAGFLNEFEANVVVLNHNELVEIPNEVFRGLYSIMVLELSYNSIKTLYPDSLKYLNGIEILDLQGNKLCTLPVGVFKNVQTLRTLNLAQNQFTSFPLGLFSPLRDLLHLNISHNRLKAFDSSILLPFRFIRLLDLSANGLVYLEVTSIQKNLPSLQWLVINDNFWHCNELGAIIQYLKNNKIDVSDYTLHRYDVMNINGIACSQYSNLPKIETILEFIDQSRSNSSSHCGL